MYISIKDLKFRTIIGLLPIERIKPQIIIINFECEYEYNNENFVDYSLIVALIKKEIRKKKFYLLEEAILHLKNEITNKFNVRNINLELIKPQIIKGCNVSIKIKNN